jgi:hypothetical protein|tara:strand:+ start:2445 stop:2777 length:333 start_codon:yes stop_codon:yes gene_type:complete
MASIISASIDVTKIPKDKIINGKKGKYVNITITLDDDQGLYGNGYVAIEQSKEERDAKVEKIYLGNPKVRWTNGNNVNVFSQDGGQNNNFQAAPKEVQFGTPIEEDDVPF